MAVVIETTIGDFTVDLYTAERPQTSRNFLKLCKLKYYNWNLFHSVQNNFIAQTGDPTGTGKGGESVYGIVLGEKARYYEGEQMPKIKHDRTGLLSMVNCGNNMLGSQFFVTLAPELHSLDGKHCVFGEITEGLEIIFKFNETICDGDHRPYQDIRISHTVILEDPFEDPKGFMVPDQSPPPTRECLMSDRIGADEVIDDTAGMTAEEIMEVQKEKEAKARATILEIVGDIPDAEMAPPENVLFVCKLNPITNDDDLEIIFSRFGKIVGCEVIRDRQSGDSLQYAFIEFADRKSCEEAYFKMDNVLIDDRRIHVDFSQSVAKMRWRGKGKGIQYFEDKNNEAGNHGRKKAGSKNKKRDETNDDVRYGKETDRRYNEEALQHRKHERRKEFEKEDSEYFRNVGKYSEKEKYREGRYRDDSCEGYEHDVRRKKERKRRSRDRSSDRSREKHRDRSRDRDRSKKESHKEHRSNKKHYEEKKRRDRESSSSNSDSSRHGRHEERHSNHKKKRNRDRSAEKYGKAEKHKQKRK
ncbi:PREDICTED: peptidyl-prolyl cis-trans isomerase-like 4 [Dufourea novaeangliae]|uniref:Peptidyl-prolyl cis-trans isomerase n=1 Tax=Dufourea novaeangliae TaxID=178035 RepID=A0A154PSH6_DUFNO|nr:PREDICTED: peptidyl-prolyl cis-trans isomerase-like 4 [Dufourea novaeangliae]KZC14852.1 Peptidyl-prolyl cis-trans isomerase-like 4 [Dufourea novaeangliae]